LRPDRDHEHGRVWRVQHKSALPHLVDDFSRAGEPALAKLLEHENRWQRIAAHRLLVERGDVNATLAIKHLYPEIEDSEPPKPNVFERFVDRVRGPKGVRIQGVDGLMVRYAQCCQPVPGDPVVGYVTRGRGVSIHRGDCPSLLLLVHEPERRLEIDWQEAQGERFLVRLALEGNDRRGLYADIASAVSSTGTDIKSMDLRSTDGRVSGSMLVEVENLAHLEKIIRATRRVKGITDVARRERLTDS